MGAYNFRMNEQERDMARFLVRKFLLDWLRRSVVGVLWAGILLFLIGADVSIIWPILWAPIGFFLTLNLVGLAFIPLYAALLSGPARRSLEATEEDKEPDEPEP